MTSVRTIIPECSICGGPLYRAGASWRGGNNAAPINKGRCCNDCAQRFVVPARVMEMEMLRAKASRAREHWRDIARGAIERSLADCIVEDGEAAVVESAYTLALDALLDAGCDSDLAKAIATDEAQHFVQP